MNKPLVRNGILLALLGVLTGFAPIVAPNARMGLAAHVGGIMNALLLLGLGAVWSAIRLSPGRERLSVRMLMAGAYGNWAVTLSASFTGAREFAPLAGAGHGAPPAVEQITLALILAVTVATIAGLGLVLSGVRR